MSSTADLPTKWDWPSLRMLCARWITGSVMIAFSVSKLSDDPTIFLRAVRQYELIPAVWYVLLNLVAVIVPWIELVGGLALISGVALRGTAAVVLMMLAGFTTAILIRTIGIIQADGTPFFEVQFDCGCGFGPETIWIKLAENLGLILLSAVIFASDSRRYCLPRRSVGL